MIIYLDVHSPASAEAGVLASAVGLENHGLTGLRRAYWNLPVPPGDTLMLTSRTARRQPRY